MREGGYFYCEPCLVQMLKRLQAFRGREYEVDLKFRKLYSISIADYGRLLDEQRGCCAICFDRNQRWVGPRDSTLFVDHDHDTGKARGLLCRRCNTGLGMLGDSQSVLTSARKYLQRHGRVDGLVVQMAATTTREAVTARFDTREAKRRAAAKAAQNLDSVGRH